jgi:glyoxylase I family protein
MRESERWRGHADTTLYMGCNELDAIYKLLASKGVTVEPPTLAQYGMHQMYVIDPDGYRLCFQHPIAA